jgi:hypothetical protein
VGYPQAKAREATLRWIIQLQTIAPRRFYEGSPVGNFIFHYATADFCVSKESLLFV